MKILILHDYGTLNGGAEHMSALFRDRLRERGHETLLFSSTVKPLDLPIVADRTCFGTASRARRLVQIANPAAAYALRRVMKEFQPDIVHVRMFLNQLSPLILPFLRSVPSLLHVVNYQLICPKNTKTLPDGRRCDHPMGRICNQLGCLPWKDLLPLLIRHRLTDLSVFRAVVTNSLWVRRRLEAEGIRVDAHIWNGVPVTPARPPLADPPTVGFAGRFVAKKGVDLLLHAMARVVEQIPTARLILLGDGPERPRIEELIRTLGLSTSVELAGHRPRTEAERLLRGAWVQVVPSLWEEPFGLVAAESMMRGTAVVASDAGGPSEVVQDGMTGFRFPGGNVTALTEALLRVLRDRTLAERMGASGRSKALEELSEDRVLDQFERIYGEITSLQDQRRTEPIRA